MIIALIIVWILAIIIFWPSAIIGLYFYIVYKLFKSTIKSYEENKIEEMTLKIIISAILCFPIAIIELLYIQTILK